LLLEYAADRGQKTTTVRLAQQDSARDFRVMDHKGKTVWHQTSSSVGQSTSAPLLWLSYSANSAAGLQSVKGNPLLLLEGGKPGIFPLDLAGSSTYPRDNPIARALRFRHGGKNPDKAAQGWDYTG